MFSQLTRRTTLSLVSRKTCRLPSFQLSHRILCNPRRLFSEVEDTALEYNDTKKVYPELKGIESKELHMFARMFEDNKAIHSKVVNFLADFSRKNSALMELQREKDILASINEKNEEKVAELRSLLDIQEQEGPEVTKRWQAELAKAKTFSLTNFAKESLEIVDNLQRSQSSLEKSFKNVPGKEEIVKSLQSVQSHLEITLAEYGVRKMEVKEREPVDPNFHHIITHIPFPGRENDEIVDVIQVGYNIENRVLRPAKVVVVKN